MLWNDPRVSCVCYDICYVFGIICCDTQLSSLGFSNKLPISAGNRVPRLIHARDRDKLAHGINVCGVRSRRQNVYTSCLESEGEGGVS